MSKFFELIVLAGTVFGVSFFPVSLVLDLVSKASRKKIDKEIESKHEDFERFGSNYVITTVKESSINNVFWSLALSCLVLISISFVFGYWFGKDEVSEIIEDKVQLLEESEDKYEELKKEIKYDLEEAGSGFQFMEEIYGYDSVEDALRHGEVNYSDLVDMYKYATRNIQNVFITFWELEQKYD